MRPQEVYTDERIYIPERDAREPARVLRMLFRDGGGGWHELTVMAPAQVISLQDLPPEVLEAPVFQTPVRAGGGDAAVAAAAPTHAAPIVSAPASELVGGIHPLVSAPAVAGLAGSATEVTGAAAAGAPSWSTTDGSHAPAVAVASAVSSANTWEQALETEAQKLLAGGSPRYGIR